MSSAAAAPVHAYIDATAGIAGDMLLAALVDAGAELDAVQGVLDALIPGSVRLHASRVDRCGQQAAKVDVEVLVEDPPHRTWSSIRTMLEQARDAQTVPARTVELALEAFGRLAQAEAAAHGVPEEEIHFHEVGALDSLADVVGACEAWRQLGITEAVGSVIAVGSGRIRAAHGDIPVPVPAVARLAAGWPTVAGEILPARGHAGAGPAHGHSHEGAHRGVHGHSHEHGGTHDHDSIHGMTRTDIPEAQLPAHMVGGPHEHGGRRVPAGVAPGIGELATPTGVALVRALATAAGPQPALTVTAIGIGAGTKDTPGRPNVVRVLVGTTSAGAHPSAPAVSAARTGASASAASAAPAPPSAAPVPSAPSTPQAPSALQAPSAPQDAHDTPSAALQLEANVDDLDPRLWPGTVDALLEHGALDAWITPITMKRGRPAITVHALVREGDAEQTAELIMDRTGTLGVRMHRVERTIRRREFTQVEVQGQSIAVKVARDADGAVRRREPEFRDVAAAAQALGISEREVLLAARSAANPLTDGQS